MSIGPIEIQNGSTFVDFSLVDKTNIIALAPFSFMCDRCSYITKSSKQLKLHQQREDLSIKKKKKSLLISPKRLFY